MNLTGKQKQFFKKEAHSLKPIFQIGKGGLSDEMIHQIQMAVEKRELIKIALLQNTDEEATEVAVELEQQTGAIVVQVIGHTVVLYKKARKEKDRELSTRFEKTFLNK